MSTLTQLGSFFLSFSVCLTKLHLLEQVVGPPEINVVGVVNREQVYRGILDCFSKTYKVSGLRGLYRGVGMDFKTNHGAVNLCVGGYIVIGFSYSYVRMIFSSIALRNLPVCWFEVLLL